MNAVVKSFSAASLCRKVDRLGALSAAIAKLRDEAEGIKEEIKASGYKVVEGKVFKAVVVAKENISISKPKVLSFLAERDILLSKDEVAEKLCNSSLSISVSLFDL